MVVHPCCWDGWLGKAFWDVVAWGQGKGWAQVPLLMPWPSSCADP